MTEKERSSSSITSSVLKRRVIDKFQKGLVPSYWNLAEGESTCKGFQETGANSRGKVKTSYKQTKINRAKDGTEPTTPEKRCKSRQSHQPLIPCAQELIAGCECTHQLVQRVGRVVGTEHLGGQAGHEALEVRIHLGRVQRIKQVVVVPLAWRPKVCKTSGVNAALCCLRICPEFGGRGCASRYDGSVFAK